MSFHFHDLIDHCHRRLTGRGTATDEADLESIKRRERENEEDYNRRNRPYDEYTDASSILRAVIKNEEDPEIYEKEAEELKRLENIYDTQRSKNDRADLDAKRDIVRKKNILEHTYKTTGGKDIKKEQFEMMKKLREGKKFLKGEQTEKEIQYDRLHKKAGTVVLKPKETQSIIRGNFMEDEIFQNDELLDYLTNGRGEIYNSKELNDPYWDTEYLDFLKNKYKTPDEIKTKALDYFPMDGVGKKIFMEAKSLDGSIEKMKKAKGIHMAGKKFGRTEPYMDAVHYECVFTKDKKTGFIKEEIFYKKDTDDIKSPKPFSGKTTRGGPRDIIWVISLEDGKYFCNLSHHPELWKGYEEMYYDKDLDEDIEFINYGLDYRDKSNPEGLIKRSPDGLPIIPIRFWKKIPKEIADK